ncbi:MAG TPA: hypothetical protein VF630_00305 [Hymenobacter sp.]|jgi:hypothetical protein
MPSVPFFRPQLLLAGALLLATSSCSIFHRKKAAPVVETVRTADSPTPATAARDLADVMATDLSLTPDQTARVRTILNGTVAQANAAKAKYPPQSAPLMTELKRINTTSQKELLAVLGPVKFKQLQANQRKMAAEMRERQK